MIALVPLFDPLARTWPFHPGDAGWRFLTLSVLIDNGSTLLAGLVLALVAALLLDDRRALKRMGLTALILGVALLVLVAMLLIHTLLLQRDLDPALRALDFGITRRLIAGILLSLASVGLGLGARRALAALPERAPGNRRTSDRLGGIERP